MIPYIRQNILGNTLQLPISEQLFEALAEARVVLMAAFGLEESYDLLIGNYVEVEKELLAAAASNAVQDLTEYKDFFELRSTVNRRVVNLLTTTRLYLDQAPQRLADCAVDPDNARSEFRQRTTEHYDGFFSYRFLEALRNHVQHCGLAVHHLSYTNKWIGEGAERAMEISVQPFSEKRYLAADGKFKRSILTEMPDKVVLMLVIREYLQCIGNLHMLVRSHIADRVLKSRQLISDQISEYSNKNNGITIGLTAFRLNSHGKQESLPLFLDWDDVRLKLVSRNSGMVALGRHVVTGRPR
ncbi:hypothetical protein [Azonexus sp.]|uniref:hypothetical protein n=1 Tax=Azonexus sp. TaxID=1872668 RepID=UPI0027BA3F59|nr:hypothetical protein [Azonexus sp.]